MGTVMRALALLLCLVAGQAWGATFYIDPTCASAGDGSTSSCSGGASAPLAGITNLLSNNTYSFKSGTTLAKTTPISISGKTGVTMNIYGGTARAKVTVDTSNHFALYIHDSTNVSVSDMSFVAIRETVSYESAIYIDESTTTDTITLSNVQASNSIGNGLSILVGVDNVTVTGGDYSSNTFTSATASANSSGILVQGASNVTISGVTANYNGFAAFASGINEGRGITITDSAGTGCSNVTVKDSVIVGNGDPLGEQGSGIEGAKSTSVQILRNFVDGNTAAEIKRAADNWTIIGNIFRGNSSGVFQYGYESPSDSINSTIINNTIISTTNAISAAVKLSSPGTGMTFKNNLIILPAGNDRAPIEFDTQGTSWAMSTWNGNFDYNAAYGPSTTSFSIELPGNTIRTLAEHKAAYPSQCASCISATNPKLVGGTSPTTASGFCLNSDSALLGAGTYIGAYIYGYGGESLTNPPPIGARGLCQSRRAAGTRRTRN